MNFYTLFFLKFILLKNRSFIWESKQKRLKVIEKIISIDADLLIVDDGAGGTNRKTTMARVKTYINAADEATALAIALG